MSEILHQFVIKAPVDKVYKALVDQKELGSWWTRFVKAEPRVDSIAEFSFEKGTVNFHMKIIRLIINKLVVWHCLGGHPEWEGTQITFELHPINKFSTVVNFSHRGWRTTTGMYAKCNFDWAHYLVSLRRYLEKGKGFPSRT